MILNELINLRSETNDYDYKEIIQMAIDDIRFNRVKFKKRTSEKQFIEILKLCKIAYYKAVQ